MFTFTLGAAGVVHAEVPNGEAELLHALPVAPLELLPGGAGGHPRPRHGRRGHGLHRGLRGLDDLGDLGSRLQSSARDILYVISIKL